VLQDGDVVAVTQKVVSKAEGRVVPEGPRGKDEWVARETRRVVARRGDLVIAETRHGFVCANAGVDASNVAEGFLTLLPEDPDASADRIRTTLADASGAGIAVIVTDTFGRPWRQGVVNVAIGSAGLPALVDLRGTKDAFGRILEATVVALADEIAGASGLVMGKADGIPAAVVRGVPMDEPARPASALIRPASEDLFRESPLQSLHARRSIRSFAPGEVPEDAVKEAVAAACTAPAPHHTRPWLFVALRPGAVRKRLLAAMATAWTEDLRSDGTAEDVIERRLRRSDALLGAAPLLIIPFVRLQGAHRYPDDERASAEREMFLLSGGAAIQNLVLALHAQGVASCWVSSTLFCKEETNIALGLEDQWIPLGAVAAGPPPPDQPPPRPPLDPMAFLREL
jgi:coenzyme F420-0:L-glutamate ligase/coenzyme F420-1:gamma-L-glutamate ligase